MVVIRESQDSLEKKFGKNFSRRLDSFSEVIGYTVEKEEGELKIEFNPDRPDLFSFYGLNRSIKCFYDKNYWIYREPDDSGVVFKIDELVRSLRLYMTSFVALGKQIGDRLQDLIDYQERLHDNVGKNRSKLSIGIHDLAKVEPPFEFKAVKSDSIKFTTYDREVMGTPSDILSKHPKGIEFANLIPSSKQVPIILDSKGEVLSMPPVINGLKSVVDSSTSKFFIDITGNDRKATRDGYFLLMNEFENMGYTVQKTQNIGSAFSELETEEFSNRVIKLSTDSTERISGLSLSQKESILLLRRMGYMAEPNSGGLSVRIPGNRPDVMGEVDIVEDIVKAYGMENVPERKMDLPLLGNPNKDVEFALLLRDLMIGIGMQEVRTFVVSSSDFYSTLHYNGGVEVLNPKSLDYSVIRDRLYVNVMELLRINKRRPMPFRVFEIGDVYVEGNQETHLCSLILDSKAAYSTVKQVLDQVARRIGISNIDIEARPVEGFISGRSGDIRFDGVRVGVIGEVSPELLVKFDLSAPASSFEIDIRKSLDLIR